MRNILIDVDKSSHYNVDFDLKKGNKNKDDKLVEWHKEFLIEYSHPSVDDLSWSVYRDRVNKETKKQPLKDLPNYNKRSFFGGYHVDHIVSIYDGYKYKIPVEIIGNIKNLRMIPSEENMLKNRRSIPYALQDMLSKIK